VVKIGWQDNPWLPETLKEEKDNLYATDPEAAAHVWGGECWVNSESRVLRRKYIIEPFGLSVKWHGPYYGADWGFASDPAAVVRCWIEEVKLHSGGVVRRLYIDKEAYGLHVEIDDLPALFKEVPGTEDYKIRADNARPELISNLRSKGFNIVAADKWPGSVKDGITVLRSFDKIIIHSDCEHVAEEARLWRYKTDRLTGDVLPDLVDRDNHTWDSVRYALEPIIKTKKGGKYAGAIHRSAA